MPSLASFNAFSAFSKALVCSTCFSAKSVILSSKSSLASGLKIKSDLSFGDLDITEFDALLIPGGWAPDYLRRLPKVIEFVKYMNKEKRIIGIICHAGWVLASANILEGVNLTSTPGIKDDLINAKAIWHNKEAVRDGHIISARRPPDLIYYLPLLIQALAE